MRTTLDAVLNAPMKTLIAAALALTALGATDMAFAKGGDRNEQIEKLKAEQAKARAEKGESASSFSFFGLFSDDQDRAEAETKTQPAAQ